VVLLVKLGLNDCTSSLHLLKPGRGTLVEKSRTPETSRQRLSVRPSSYIEPNDSESRYREPHRTVEPALEVSRPDYSPVDVWRAIHESYVSLVERLT